MMFPPPPVAHSAAGSPNRRPNLASLQSPGSPTVRRPVAVAIEEPNSPHYVPRGFSSDPAHAGLVGSPFLLDGDAPSAFDGLNVSTGSAAPTSASSSWSPDNGAFSPPLRVQDFFSLPPLLVVCLVRHIGKTGEVLATPQSVEQVVRDLQTFFSTPIPTEQIHTNKNIASGGGGIAASDRGGRQPPTQTLPGTRQAMAGSIGQATAYPMATAGAATRTGGVAGSSCDQFHKAYPGSRLSLQFGKAVDLYSTGGSAILNLFIYAVDESSSRPRLMAQVAKDWKEHLSSPAGGGENSCMVVLYHKDMVAAAHATGAVNKSKVEAAAALLETYYSELRLLHFAPQQMSAYHPQETPVRLLERLRTACAERTDRLKGLYEAYQRSKRSLALDPLIAKEVRESVVASSAPSLTTGPTVAPTAPSSNAATTTKTSTTAGASTSYNINLDLNTLAAAASAAAPPGAPPPASSQTTTTYLTQTSSSQTHSQSSSQHLAAAKPSSRATWNVQQFWRLGYDLALHFLQFGLVQEAQTVFQVLYVEYYNNSDDYKFVTKSTTLERLGRVPSLFDPRRPGTEPGRSGYPRVLEPSAELLDGLLYLAAADMACCALLNNMTLCKARYDTFVQVAREKFAEDAEDPEERVTVPKHDVASRRHRGMPRVLQQFFLLQCFMSGLRMFWPLYRLTVAVPLPSQEQRQRQQEQQQTPDAGVPQASAAHRSLTSSSPPNSAFSKGDTPVKPLLTTAAPTPFKSNDLESNRAAGGDSPEPILTPLELDGRTREEPSPETETPSSPLGDNIADLKFSMIAPPPGFLDSLPGSSARARGRKGGALTRTPSSGTNEHDAVAVAAEGEEGEEEDVLAMLPDTLRRMLHLDDTDADAPTGDEDAVGGEDSTGAAVRHSLALLRIAFDSGTDTDVDAVAFLIQLAQGVGFLPLTEAPVEADRGHGTRSASRARGMSAKRQHQVQVRCAHIADLAINARECLSYIGDALGFADVTMPKGKKGAVAAFSGGRTEMAADSPSTILPHASPLASATVSATPSAERRRELQTHFSNVEELETPESATRFWRLLTVMASVALRIAGQRRREFNLYTRLALTYLDDDPATTMRIAARRLIPFIRDHGWWHLEYFVRRLYVESAEHLMAQVEAAARDWAPTRRGQVWRLLFVDEETHALYKECILFLIHKVREKHASAASVATGESEDYVDMGSLDNRVFRPRSQNELWRKLLAVDALVEEPVFRGRLPEYPLLALVTAPDMHVRKAASRVAPTNTHEEGSDVATLDSGAKTTAIAAAQGDPAQPLRAELDEAVECTFVCRSPVNVIPTHSGQPSEWQVVLESRKDWADALEATHVVTVSSDGVDYDPASGQLAVRFRFTACHAGHYRLRSVSIVNGATRLSFYPREAPPCAMPGCVAEHSSYGRERNIGWEDLALEHPTNDSSFPWSCAGVGRGFGCAAVGTTLPNLCSRILFRVPEPASGIRLRVSAPTEEHCFADALSCFTVHVDMEKPLGIPAAGPLTPLVSAHGDSKPSTAANHSPLAKEVGRQSSSDATAPMAAPPSAREVVQEKLRKKANTSVDGGSRSDCAFESSPAALPASLGFMPSGALAPSHRSTSPAETRFTATHTQAAAMPMAAAGSNRSMGSQALLLENSLNLKSDPTVVAVLQVAPPKAAPSHAASSSNNNNAMVSGISSATPARHRPRSPGRRLASPNSAAAAIGTAGSPLASVGFPAFHGAPAATPPATSTSRANLAYRDSPAQFDEGRGAVGGMTSGMELTLASRSTSPQYYNTGVTVEFASDGLSLSVGRGRDGTPGASMNLNSMSGGITGTLAYDDGHHLHHYHHHRSHQHESRHPEGAERDKNETGSPSAVQHSPPSGSVANTEATEVFSPLRIGGEEANEDAATRTPQQQQPRECSPAVQDPARAASPYSAGSSGGLDHVRLALHPAANLRCAGDRFTPVALPGTSAGTQVRVTILEPPQSPQIGPAKESQSVARVRYHDDEGDVPSDALPNANEKFSSLDEAVQRRLQKENLYAAAPRTIIPFDEAAVMNHLSAPTADSTTALPLQMMGAVSIYPKRECTFRLSVANDDDDNNNDDALSRVVDQEQSFREAHDENPPREATASSNSRNPLARTRHMVLRLPLLPLFMSRSATSHRRTSLDGALDRAKTADASAEGTAPQQHSTVSFTCLRGRETCTSTASISFPFSQAISTSFAFRHFQSRVYCLVTLTNELERTSLWLRGVLLRILDMMPTYEVVRVSESYESLLSREWKAKESLTVLYELALCRNFQPTEAVLHHRVHVEVFYSDWQRTYKVTPENQRIVLKPMRLPDTEAGAESVRIDDVSLRMGEVSGGSGGATAGAPDLAEALVNKEASFTQSQPHVGSEDGRTDPLSRLVLDERGGPLVPRDGDLPTSSSSQNASPLGLLGREVTQPLSTSLGSGSRQVTGGSTSTVAADSASLRVQPRSGTATGLTQALTADGRSLRASSSPGSSPPSPSSSSHAPRDGLGVSPGKIPHPSDSSDAGDRSLDNVGGALRFNPVFFSLLSATCNTYISQEVVFRSKHLCLFSAVMYAESPWTTRFGAATNYASASSRFSAGGGGSGVPRTLSEGSSSGYDVSTGTATASEVGLMGDAMVDQPSDFRFVAGEPVRFCVRLEPNAHNWPEDAGVEEDFFIQLQYDPQQWMIIGKQRERRTLSLMEDVTVNFTAVPLLPPAEEEGEEGVLAGGGKTGTLASQSTPTGGLPAPHVGGGLTATDATASTAISGRPKVRFAGTSVRDEGVLETPTIKMFWANQESTADVKQVLVDVVRFRTSVKVYKKVR